ncbi:MAG: DNA primase DnaG [Candidatus Methanomethylophilaceae archaeon]|nr:DNA primase DnaG [Candidatus Methanomethylophilaceae archaeon]
MVKAKLTADGIVEKPDVVGAIFGQTEGLLGEELDLRDLQKSGRIGRIDVDVSSKSGKSDGVVLIPSSLDQVETVILASALETIDRIGPCRAQIRILGIEDVRISKREKIVDRAKELLNDLIKQSKSTTLDLTESVKQSVQVEEITIFGKERLPAGPAVKDSDSIIIVEGRSDVLNLLRSGIKNAVAVEGTNIPRSVQELSKERISIAFVDGDRGGELILRELFQVAEIDFVARAPRALEVEELTPKQIIKCLKNKVSSEQYMEMNNIPDSENGSSRKKENGQNGHGRHSDHARPAAPAPKKEEATVIVEETPEAPEPEPRPAPSRPAPKKDEKFNTEAAERFKKKDNGKEAREPREPREPREKKAPAPKPAKKLSPEQEKYRDILAQLSTTRNARLLDGAGEIVREVEVKELVNSLKEDSTGIDSIVFDGVISQRILDIALTSDIKTIVGSKMGAVSKQPADLAVWTRDDLL